MKFSRIGNYLTVGYLRQFHILEMLCCLQGLICCLSLKVGISIINGLFPPYNCFYYLGNYIYRIIRHYAQKFRSSRPPIKTFNLICSNNTVHIKPFRDFNLKRSTSFGFRDWTEKGQIFLAVKIPRGDNKGGPIIPNFLSCLWTEINIYYVPSHRNVVQVILASSIILHCPLLDQYLSRQMRSRHFLVIANLLVSSAGALRGDQLFPDDVA